MGYISTDEQSRLLAHLYSGTIEYGHWADFLRILSASFEGVNCSLATVNVRSGKPIVQYTSRTFDRSWYDRYTAHFARVSPLRPIMFKRENIGRAVACHQAMAPAEFENSEFYTDYLSDYDIRYVLGSVFKVGEGTAAYIAVHRSRRAGAFENEQIAALQNLLPHLGLAYRIRSQFVGMGRYEDISQQYLDAKNKGLICLDRHCRIVSMNREAERILTLNDGLSYLQDRFQTQNREDDQRLAQMIARCSQADMLPAESRNAVGGSLLLRRSDGKPHYNLWIFPVIGRNAHFEDNQIAAAIEITDPLARQRVPAQSALAGFNLTKAELRLAEALIVGGQLKDIATRFNVSVNTLKVQRRSLYRKIGATRHFDLLSLVHREN